MTAGPSDAVIQAKNQQADLALCMVILLAGINEG